VNMFFKRFAALLLALLVCSPLVSLAEEVVQDEEEPEHVVLVNEGYLMLASAAMPLSEDYAPAELDKLVSRRNDSEGNNENDGVYTTSSTSIQLVPEAAAAITEMMLDAYDCDVILYAKQGYRSYADEAKRYERMKSRDPSAPKPGETDYQTGLAITLVSKEWQTKNLTEEFGQTEEAKWIARNCARYGFVLRYPEGKQHITGVAWEPWHLRYVGEDAADIMQLNHLCLEEFLEGVGLTGAVPDQSALPLPEETPAPDGEADPVPAGMTLLHDIPFETPIVLPEGPLVLDKTGPDGDNEIVLFHD